MTSDSEFGAESPDAGSQTEDVATRPLDDGEFDAITRHEAVPTIDVGQQVGRYVVLRELGRGGMSVVYAAFDPQLDRRVALKLMRPGGTTSVRESSQRLQREAQALARLSHANVVHVYDVGTVGGDVYIAMEMVEGQTLRTWLSAETRRWEEVLDVLVRAGAGLAAAHDAGLVHLDFKPSNVLIGDDGRVRVVDFGLAREPRQAAQGDLDDSQLRESSVPEPSGDSRDSEARSSTTRLAEPLTELGALVGTPGYIAPERLMGIEADARSDQFSFCVTLWEGLYGKRPFRGSSRRELDRTTRRGKLRDPKDMRGVPVWVHHVVCRGLHRDPEQRYPDLRALLAALRHDPVRRRRRVYLVAGSLGVAGALLAAHEALLDRKRVRCRDTAASLHDAWNEDRARRVADAFVESGLPYAADAWNKVRPEVDAYIEQWGEGRVDACEATHVRGDQSAELLDARILCLDRARKDVEVAIDLLEAADARTIENSLETVEGLPSLAACADPDQVREEASVAPDPEVRAEVEDLDAEYARLGALHRSGHYAEAQALAPPLFARARRLDQPALLARYSLDIASVYTQLGLADEAEAVLDEGLHAAEVAELDLLRAAILSEYTYLVGNLEGNLRRAQWFARAAHAALDRVGGNVELRGDLLTNEVVLAALAGDVEQAIEISTRVLKMRDEFGFGSLDTHASILGNMGSAYFNAGDYEQALDHYEQAYRVRLDVFGPRHPTIAISLENLGNALAGLGRSSEALQKHREAYELTVRAKIPEGIRFAILLNNIAVSLHSMGKNDEAAEYWERSARVWEHHDPNHSAHGVVLCNLGELDRIRGDHEIAMQRYRRAREILAVSSGDDHPYMALALGGLGRALADLGQFQAARPHLQRAQAIYEADHFDDVNPAETDFHLARSLWMDPARRTEALALAREARRSLEKAGPKGASVLREVLAWLEGK